MLQRIVSILLLSLLVSGLNAQQGELSAEEYQRRDAELRMLANRFKQETGFEGTIQYNHQMMKLSHFMGSFENIVFPPASDSIAVKQVFNQVVDLIMPFLPASREQLTIESITGDERGVRAQIRQTVNGYEIEGAGILRIFYEYEKNRVTIMNALVPIDPTPVTPRITEEEARRIFYANVDIPESRREHPLNKVVFKLMYCFERKTPDSGLPDYPIKYRLA